MKTGAMKLAINREAAKYGLPLLTINVIIRRVFDLLDAGHTRDEITRLYIPAIVAQEACRLRELDDRFKARTVAKLIGQGVIEEVRS